MPKLSTAANSGTKVEEWMMTFPCIRNCITPVYSLIFLLFFQPNANALGLGPETVTFDNAINGVPFFNYDSNDPDNITDVVFSTTDPEGFNTAGPGPDQLFIDEPGLEGSTGRNPDLRVDFLQGAVGTVSSGFALIADGQATFTAYNAANVPIGTQTLQGDFFPLPGGDTSNFPENQLVVPLSGTATYGLFDFNLFGGSDLFGVSVGDGGPSSTGAAVEPDGRYIIDNFTFTPASEDIIGGFQGALPDDPILPGEIVQGPNNVPEFNFEFPVDENGLGGVFPIFVDPVVSIGYVYNFTGGPNAASVLIPAALANGDDMFTLTLPGLGDFPLQAGIAFDLTGFTIGGFSSLTITGIDTSELLDPNDPNAFVTGFTYVGGGVSNLTMTPITLFVPSASTPTPSVLALLGIGLLGIAGQRRRSRNHRGGVLS